MSANTTTFPSLRTLVRSIQRPDMYAIKAFFKGEVSWMRDIIDEQTKLILSLQQVIISYNDIMVDLISRMNSQEQTMASLIQDKANGVDLAAIQAELTELIHSLQGSVSSLESSSAINSTTLSNMAIQLNAITTSLANVASLSQQNLLTTQVNNLQQAVQALQATIDSRTI